ncbi:cytochrome d ubiquinol oxidase subunit II [Mangrovibacillus cuniculi]|uniref:Cytochrome d ubiquinol oxidase subunit II n=1 Tax=Mangrovibacillus cuniculi TaxID=2593652 RepID=A0A7S8CC90_9BACI|nr:cytochrome d ubiquinol oxidase subunit II [Mangrovibacillus cuniculi]QPC47313.1 hypothetical protein G8O30_10195 [Mangrovibacillus cuniculi]
MSEQLIAVTILWGFVFIYAVMATMDFGAGFWSMIYLNKEQTKATNIANRYLSPTWEVTNTFIVAIVVAIYSFFPGAAFTLGTILLIPGSIILLLLAIRSGFMVFSHVADDYRVALTYISGITGLLIPGFLIAVLPISHGGFVELESAAPSLDLQALFTSPHVYSFIGFAISSTLFLSSLLLADYSKTAGEPNAYKVYRRDSIILGPISLVMAVLIMLTMRNEANWLYTNMMEQLPLLLLSVAFFVIGGLAIFVFKDRHGMKGVPRIAVIAVTIQYLLASYVYGRAHLPYFIYPSFTIEDGFTDSASFQAVFITYIVGFLILFPGFFYFWRIFMKDSHVREDTQTE